MQIATIGRELFRNYFEREGFLNNDEYPCHDNFTDFTDIWKEKEC